MIVRTLILSDVRLFRDGLAGLLRASPLVDITGAAATVEDAITLAMRDRPDAILVDMAIVSALACVRALAGTVHKARIIVIGVPETATDVIACAEAGAAGYIPREASADDLVAALEAAVRGELRCSTTVAAALLERVKELSRVGAVSSDPTSLTERELDVLALLETGESNKGIARELGITLATVKNHVHKILEKLGVHGRAQAIALAVRPPPRRDKRRVGASHRIAP